MKRTRPILVPLLLSLALVLAACGDGPADEPDDTTEEPDPTDDAETDDGEAEDDAAAPDEPADDVTIRLMTHDSFDVSTDVLEAFTTETGIDVEVVPMGDAGTALNQAILTADQPQGDLLFGVDTTFLSRALDADLFQSYESPRLEAVPERYQLDPEHRLTPIDVGDVCLNYDVGWFEDAGIPVPQDLSDLLDEQYEGLLAVQNPATSSPGLAFLLATIDHFGESGYLDAWETLRDNDVLVTDGWTEAYYGEFTAASDGDRPIVVSYASSPPAEVFFADPMPDEAPTGVIEASCIRQIEFVGILGSTEHPDEAQQLVDFMLSTTFQEDIPLTMFVFPVVDDADLPQVFVDHAVLPDDPLDLDPQVIGENREQWIDEWTRTVLR
ncbi:MAG: thiamine ABC transporter substrate-binding protein [Nitriliruptor sp.]|nr:MAG: thiamine ABC transporter substrate-binding protein [Nitriliruptor sp.]